MNQQVESDEEENENISDGGEEVDTKNFRLNI